MNLIFAFLTLGLSFASMAATSSPFAKRYKVLGSIRVPLAGSMAQHASFIELNYKITNPDQTDLPLLFMVGGGPSFPSIDSYNSMVGYEYGARAKELQSYAKYFRVVVFDQRGTGQSSPLDPEWVWRHPKETFEHFSTLSHARDFAQLISEVARPDEPFYIAGHSYGGEVVLKALEQNLIRPKPKGVLLFSPLPSVIGSHELFEGRIRDQIRISRNLLGDKSELQQKIVAAKQKIRNLYRISRQRPEGYLRASGELLRVVFHNHLGNLEANLDKILSSDVSSHRSLLNVFPYANPIDMSGYLLHVLDWRFRSAVSQSDLVNELDPQIKKTLEAEPWLITEVDGLMSDNILSLFPRGTAKKYRAIDEKLKDAFLPFHVDAVRLALKEIPMIYLAADQDAFVPLEQSKKAFAAISTPTSKWHHFEPIEGGNHFSSLEENVADFVSETLPSLGREPSALDPCEAKLQ